VNLGSPFEQMMADVYSRAATAQVTAFDVTDVGKWAYEMLGVDLWTVQAQVLQSSIENRRTAVWSCHDTGKTFGAAVLTCHHVGSHTPRTARVITTAPSHHQVRGALWGDINTLHERAAERGTPLPGRVNQTEWWVGTYMAGIGRKPSDYRPDQFAGLHARFPLVLLDEADGLSADMWEGIEALMTNRRARLFAIGNPLDPGSRFAAIRKRWESGSTAYHGVVIPYDVTPNFTGEQVSEVLKDSLLSQEWVEDKRREWGDPERAEQDPSYQPLDNPFWWGRVLAQYPPEDASAIITAAYVLKCDDVDEPPPEVGKRQLGVDVAGSEKGDWTVCRERRGNAALRRWAVRTSDDDEVEEFIVRCAVESGAQALVFDGTGLGFGFKGRLRRRLPHVAVSAVNFAASATVKEEDGRTRKFANMRAQLWWEVGRESMRQGLWNLAHMEHHDETIVELTAARLDQSKGEVIQVESKQDIRKRIGRSPDDADALLLAFYEPSDSGVAKIRSARGRALPTGTRTVVSRGA
jgi:hypothetical protein